MLLLFSVYAVGCLSFSGVIRGQRPLIVHPHPNPLPGREREGKRIKGEGKEICSPLPERVRGKETATGDEYTTLAVTK